MIEALTQAAAVLVLDRDRPARRAARGAARRQQRQVPPRRRARRRPAPRGDAAAARGRGWPRRRRRPTSTTRRRGRGRSCCWPSSPAPASRAPDGHRAPGARIGAARSIGPHCVIGPDVTHRRALPDRRVGRHRRQDRDRRRDGDLSDGVDRAGAAGSQVPRRADAAHDRPAQHLPRVRHHQPRHRGRRRRDARSATTTCSWPTCTWRTTATSAATPSSARTRRSAATCSVEDFANISAGSAVHQFCRVGRHAFVGGYSVVTKDALPFARTIGSRPARIFGVNSIGLSRRGFTPDTIAQLQAGLPLSAAVEAEHHAARSPQIEQDAEPDRAGGARSSWTSSAPRSAASSSGARPRRAEELVAEE